MSQKYELAILTETSQLTRFGQVAVMTKDDDPIMAFYSLEVARLTVEVFNKPCFGEILAKMDGEFTRDDLIKLAGVLLKKIMEIECTDTKVET